MKKSMSKILIIEDEVDLAKILHKRLEDKGFEVVCAPDAHSGVDLAHKERPDLIILDIMLPLGGGVTVLRNLRISTHTMSIPVLVLTGMQDEELKKNILEMGVAFYMQKPYEIEELTKEINRILTERGGKSA